MTPVAATPLSANLRESGDSYCSPLDLPSRNSRILLSHHATFLGYPRSLVRVIAARLHEARIWEPDKVDCESWFEPDKGESPSCWMSWSRKVSFAGGRQNKGNSSTAE
jgi:hypothetical protein